MGRYKENLVGQRFGRLLVIGEAKNYITPKGKEYTQWTCKCDCGKEVVVRATSLKSGDTTSCGCYMKEAVYNANKKYNTYDLTGEYGIGYTSKGEEFYFDLEDYDLIKDYCWYIHKGYVVSMTKKNSKQVFFHKLLFWNKNTKDIDHINHKGNDNRKDNLRVCSHQENMMNRKKPLNNTSGVMGVYKYNNKWVSKIGINRKFIHLGYFDDFEDAVRARKEAEDKYFGEFSYDNSTNG